MFGWLKRKAHPKQDAQGHREAAALKLGMEAGRGICDAVDRYFDARTPELTLKLLDVFRQRLKTIHDEPNHAPESVARLEFQIFVENLDRIGPELRAEVNVFLSRWMEIAAATGTRELIEDYVARKITDLRSTISLEAGAVLAEEIGMLPKDKPRANEPSG